jgi:hypothetical protein
MIDPVQATPEGVQVKPERFTALDPSCGAFGEASADRQTAARETNLNGAVVAVVDNGFNPTFAKRLIEVLRARFKLADVIYVLKDNVSVPPRKPDWERIKAQATAGIALYGG